MMKGVFVEKTTKSGINLVEVRVVGKKLNNSKALLQYVDIIVQQDGL